MAAEKSIKKLSMIVGDLEDLVYRAEQLNSFCLVINNALEGGNTAETQYIPAVELMGNLMADFTQQFSKCFETITKEYELHCN